MLLQHAFNGLLTCRKAQIQLDCRDIGFCKITDINRVLAGPGIDCKALNAAGREFQTVQINPDPDFGLIKIDITTRDRMLTLYRRGQVCDLEDNRIVVVGRGERECIAVGRTPADKLIHAVSGLPCESVAADSARGDVCTWPARDVVVAGAACDNIIAVLTRDAIVMITAFDPVAAYAAFYLVFPSACHDIVVTRTGKDRVAVRHEQAVLKRFHCNSLDVGNQRGPVSCLCPLCNPWIAGRASARDGHTVSTDPGQGFKGIINIIRSGIPGNGPCLLTVESEPEVALGKRMVYPLSFNHGFWRLVAAVYLIVPLARVDQVVARITPDRIVPLTGLDLVVTSTAIDRVVARAADQDITACIAVDCRVTEPIGPDRVFSVTAVQVEGRRNLFAHKDIVIPAAAVTDDLLDAHVLLFITAPFDRGHFRAVTGLLVSDFKPFVLVSGLAMPALTAATSVRSHIQVKVSAGHGLVECVVPLDDTALRHI